MLVESLFIGAIFSATRVLLDILVAIFSDALKSNGSNPFVKTFSALSSSPSMVFSVFLASSVGAYTAPVFSL